MGVKSRNSGLGTAGQSKPEERLESTRPDAHRRFPVPGAAASAPSRIELHIEELVLHGFDARDRHRIGDAVQRELTRLFGEPLDRTPLRTTNADSLDAGEFKVEPSARPERVGYAIARAIHDRLTKGIATAEMWAPGHGGLWT